MELAEAETICQRLRPLLLNRKIQAVSFKADSRLLRNTFSAPVLRRYLIGATVKQIERRGKYLLLKLEGGHVLVWHLGMTGKLVDVPPGRTEPHTHARFRFDGFDLLFCDPRTFGRIAFLPHGRLSALPGLANLGPEPLGPHFTAAYLLTAFRHRRAAIKSLLLDQRIVAGLGNIYVDEALFRARLHPLRPAGSLSLPELKQLRRAIRLVLHAAIRYSGTTILNYEWAPGRQGQFQNRLLVYGRAGQTCRNCSGRIAALRISGRTSSFCPRCQPQKSTC